MQFELHVLLFMTPECHEYTLISKTLKVQSVTYITIIHECVRTILCATSGPIEMVSRVLHRATAACIALSSA